MRRLIAILAASAMLIGSVGTVAAQSTPQKALAKGQRTQISVSRNVVQGGKAWMTVKITRCDRSQLKAFTITATTDLTTASPVTLNRVGTVKHGSNSRACVWRASIGVAANAAVGAHTTTFSISRPVAGGATAMSTEVRTMTVHAPDASGGTEHSGGTDHSSGSH